MLARLEQGAPFSVSVRGTTEAIASFPAQGAGRQAWITDIAGAVDAASGVTQAQLFVDAGSTTLFNIGLGSANSIPFSHSFLSPLRASADQVVRVRVGSASVTSWAFIGGYWLQL